MYIILTILLVVVAFKLGMLVHGYVIEKMLRKALEEAGELGELKYYVEDLLIGVLVKSRRSLL